MKIITHLLILAFIIISTHAFSQSDSIPNSGFETWLDFTDPVYSKPQSWYTADSLIAKYNMFSTVEKDTSAHSGNYSARLTTKTINLPFIGTLDFPGILTLGHINIYPLGIGSGIPDTLKPHHMKGFYKYAPQNDDSCMIVAFLIKFVPSKGKHDTIGIAKFIGGGVNTWTEFKAVFNYSAIDKTPDSMNIVILSSADTSNVNSGSTLWVDDLSMEMVSGIEDHYSSGLKTNIYPNPATDHINLVFEEAVENAELIIFSGKGTEMYSGSDSHLCMAASVAHMVIFLPRRSVVKAFSPKP